jgi:hypothetical protein
MSNPPDRAGDENRQPKITNWDDVPAWSGPGSWESTQPVSESWKKRRDELKIRRENFRAMQRRLNSMGD